MRPTAQIDEVAMAVDAYGLALRQRLNDLNLERLVGERTQRGFTAQLLILEREIPRYGRPHVGINALQVLRGKGAGDLKVVVEAIVRWRADGQLGVREKLEDSVRHEMRRGVTYALPFRGQVARVTIRHPSHSSNGDARLARTTLGSTPRGDLRGQLCYPGDAVLMKITGLDVTSVEDGRPALAGEPMAKLFPDRVPDEMVLLARESRIIDSLGGQS